MQSIAAEVGCHHRTVRRDLKVLQSAGLPISSTLVGGTVCFYVGEMTAWPRDAYTPVAEIPREAHR